MGDLCKSIKMLRERKLLLALDPEAHTELQLGPLRKLLFGVFRADGAYASGPGIACM